MKLSIITVNFNNAAGLAKTLESVRTQTFRDFEQIVIDGGSTDGSVELITNHAATLCHWVSERDSGPYDAMNKGARNARGEWLLFLNSGDALAEADVLREVAPLLTDGGQDICVGAHLATWPDGRPPILKSLNGVIDRHHFYRRTVNHQSTFIGRAVFERFGPYDTSYRIIADREFFARATLAGVRCRTTSILIAHYDMSGISTQAKISGELQKETRRLQQLYPLSYRLRRAVADSTSHRLNRLYKRLFPQRAKRGESAASQL